MLSRRQTSFACVNISAQAGMFSVVPSPVRKAGSYVPSLTVNVYVCTYMSVCVNS